MASQAITVGGQEGELLAYLEKFKVSDSMEEMLTEVVRSKPADPFPTMADWIVTNRVSKAITIHKLVAREVLDGTGNPTVEVDCYVNVRGVPKLYGRAQAPNAKTPGPNDPEVLVDEESEGRYGGKGRQRAVVYANTTLSAAVSGVNPCEQPRVDDCLSGAEGAGGASNAVVAASLAIAEAAAKVKDIQLFEYIAFLFKGEVPASYPMPVPIINVISGGQHAVGAAASGRTPLRFQEFWLIPSPRVDEEAVPVEQQVRVAVEVFHKLGGVIAAKFGGAARAAGDQGAYMPAYPNAHEALLAIEEAIAGAGYTAGKEVNVGLDVAATSLWNEELGKYEWADDPKAKGGAAAEMVLPEDFFNKIVQLLTDHPSVIAVEDPVRAGDTEGWAKFTEKYGATHLVIGDCLFSGDVQSVRDHIESKHANTLLLKPDVFTTVNKSVSAAQMLAEASDSKGELVVSHRNGESAGTALVDLAVGLGAGYIKLGAPRGGEHVSKINRLLQIEGHLHSL